MGDAPAEADRPLPGSVVLRALASAAVGLFLVVLVTTNRAIPVEARQGQRVELVGLIQAEQERNAELAARVEELSQRIDAYERDGTGGGGQAIAALSAQVDALAAPAGMTAVAGPGLVVQLRDSSLAPPPDGDYNDYIIHEEDLQSVINALWAGGAEAMSVNGDRILATTAIRCVGNVLLLHGKTHSPPYVIEAIGDETELRAALDRDAGVRRFSDAVLRFQLGFSVESEDELLIPAFEGVTAMQHARPIDSPEAP